MDLCTKNRFQNSRNPSFAQRWGVEGERRGRSEGVGNVCEGRTSHLLPPFLRGAEPMPPLCSVLSSQPPLAALSPLIPEPDGGVVPLRAPIGVRAAPLLALIALTLVRVGLFVGSYFFFLFFFLFIFSFFFCYNEKQKTVLLFYFFIRFSFEVFFFSFLSLVCCILTCSLAISLSLYIPLCRMNWLGISSCNPSSM